jgi:hypothetical protein
VEAKHQVGASLVRNFGSPPVGYLLKFGVLCQYDMNVLGHEQLLDPEGYDPGHVNFGRVTPGSAVAYI